MKRILTILLMTVAFAMNVSVVNAKNSTGQGGTGKEFMMAMMADGDPKWGPNDEYTYKYETADWGSLVVIFSVNTTGGNYNFYASFSDDGKTIPTTTVCNQKSEQIQNITFQNVPQVNNGTFINILVQSIEYIGGNPVGTSIGIYQWEVSLSGCKYNGRIDGGGDDPVVPTITAPTISDSWSDSFTDPSHTFSITNKAGNGYDIYYRFIGDKNSDAYNTVDNLSSFTKSTDGQVNLYPDNFTNYDNFSTITLQAIAVSSSDNSKYSEIASKTFTKTTPAAQINYSNGKINVTSGDACYLTVNKDNQGYGQISNQSTSYDYNGTSAVAVYARSIKQQYLFSSKATYTNSGTQQTSAPSITCINNVVTITNNSADSGATIYYTTDGTTPTTSSTQYTSPFNIASTCTVKAIAVTDGKDPSTVVSQSCTFVYTAPPTFNRTGNIVSISCETTGATIYYTTDGNDPTISSDTYSEPINIPEDGFTLKAIAVASPLGVSSIKSELYTYTRVTATPTFSRSGNTITISSEEGATIHYGYWRYPSDYYSNIEMNQTSSGNTATVELEQYINPTTIRAYASKNGQDDSEIVISDSYYWEQQSSAPAAPSISINHGFVVETADGGGYTISNTLTFTESTSGANIYYTTDGTDPKSSGTIVSNNQVVIGLDDNYSNVTKIRAVAELSGTYSDETTMDKAYTPELSTNGTTLSITQNDANTYIFYHGDGETTWTCMKSGRSIDNYANIAPVSVVAATAGKLLSNIAVQNGGGTLPTSGDWDCGSWQQGSNGANTIVQIYGSSAKLLRYTVSGTRGQNEPTASSGTETTNQNSVDIPVSTLADGTHYVQLYAVDYSTPPLPLGVYTWKVTKNGNSYTYEYLGKNEDTPTTLPAPVFTESFQGRSGQGEVAPFVYFGISNYGDIIATEGNQVLYSFDQTNWKSTFDTKDTAPGVGCILAYASEFEGSGNTVTIYAKTVNGNNESAVVSKTYTKTVAPTVVHNHNNGKITITAANTGWDEIMFSTDGGHNWFIHNFNDGNDFVVYPTTQDAPSYDGESPLYVLARAFKSGGDYIYSDQDCFIGPAPIKQLKYHYSEMENWFEVNSVVGLKIRYTLDGKDPKTSETAIEFRMDSVYMDKPLCSSLEVDSKTVKTVATDGYGHFSDVVEKTFTKSPVPEGNLINDNGSSIEIQLGYDTQYTVSEIFTKVDDNNWPTGDGSTSQLVYNKSEFQKIQTLWITKGWQYLVSDMLIIEKITPPTLSYNQNANQVTISCEEGKTLKYSTNGGTTWQTADGQSKTLAVPQEGLSVQAYCTETKVDYPVVNKTTIYTSNVSTGNYTYTNTDPSITVSANWEGGADGTTYLTLSNIFTITAPGYEGGTIYYTTDGTDPTTSSSVYDPENKPQLVVGDNYALTSSYTIKVLAVAVGKENLTFSQTFEKTANTGDNTAITIEQGTNSGKYAKVSIDNENNNGFVYYAYSLGNEDRTYSLVDGTSKDNIEYGNNVFARTIEDGKLISNTCVYPAINNVSFAPYWQAEFIVDNNGNITLPLPEYGEDDCGDDGIKAKTGKLYQGITSGVQSFAQIASAKYKLDNGDWQDAEIVKGSDNYNILVFDGTQMTGTESVSVQVTFETGQTFEDSYDDKLSQPTLKLDGDKLLVSSEDAEGVNVLISADGGNTWRDYSVDRSSNNNDGDVWEDTYTHSYDEETPFTISAAYIADTLFANKTINWSDVRVCLFDNSAGALLSDTVGISTIIKPEWTDWEPYGRGTWTDHLMKLGSDKEGEAHTYDISVSTNRTNPNLKRIRIPGWSTDQVGKYNQVDEDGEETGVVNEYTQDPDHSDDEYNDFIIEWNMSDNSCKILTHNTGLIKDDEKYIYLCNPTEYYDVVGKNIIPDYWEWDYEEDGNGKYDPETDTYTVYVKLSENSSNSINYDINGSGYLPLAFTLKMEGMWLGDLDDKNNGIQNSYMPQLSQYKIGLVKIPTATNNTNKYLEFDSKGVCRIVLDEGDFNDFFNTTNDNLIILTERHWIDSADEKGEGTLQPLLENSTDTYKMLHQFTIRDEGAYYIVVARLVPSYDNEGNKIYEYTGAYQYMPVYYSPKGNWVTLNGRHYKEDIVGGLYASYRYSEYDVEVQENINYPGIYRVKNMYGENYQGNTKEFDDEEENYVDKERFSYQGESPYRQNVYFYIDARDTTDVKLLNNMFYAQPLGVDWGYGEMMLVDLGTGVFESGHIKFNSDDKNGNPIGTMYEWEDYDGYEYDGDPRTCYNTNDAGHEYGTQGNAPGNIDNRFDLYIDDYTDWTEFELYGRGAWGQSDSKKYNYKKENTTDIYISTNKKNPNLKRIKIMGWGPSNDAEFAGFDKDENYTCDLVFDWNMENNTCYVSNPQYTGFSSGDKKLWTITSLASEKYDTTVDSYEFRLDYSSNISGNNSRSFTLKMDGLWLGDMTEEGNTATQEAFMPQNSHYKIGLVKIDGKDLAEDCKYYIELEDADAVEAFFDTNANTNFVDGTVKERHLKDGNNYIPLETGNENETVMKMKEEFHFDADDDDEGAYYIVAARLVPGLVDENGNKHYDYSGAYRYMPVYYSPSRNWTTLSYDGMRTYRDDLAYGYGWYELEEVYNKEIEEAPVYSVEVQENKYKPGLFRVKNMYHSGFLGVDDSEFTSYQGESSYRDGVYFYIDATQKDMDGNTIAELFPSEFYAQPLGIDLLNGEYMMTSLNGGKYVDGQIIFEDEGYIFEYDNIFEFFNYWQSGNIVKNNGLIKMDSSVNWHDGEQFQLQISTPYPLFDDTPYTTTDMNPKWPDEYEDNSEDYNEKYGEVWAMFDEESDYYEDYHEEWYTDGITKGQDHVDVTYERNITNCYGTIMMPFDFNSQDLVLMAPSEDEENEEDVLVPQDGIFELYEFARQEGQELVFTKAEDAKANTPIVFKFNGNIPENAKLTIDIKDTEVKGVSAKDYGTLGVVLENDGTDNWQTIGAYTPLGVESQFEQGSKFSANGIYWYVTKYGLDKSYAFTGNEINKSTQFVRTKQYRAFFYNKSASSSPAKSFMVVYDDNPIFTDIDSVVDGRSKRAGSYNVAGQKVNRNYRGVVIENGKKSIRIKR